ncbi:MAG: serine/threonine protein kinase, partial [Sandaracinaceae bacterium]|nr:serine/threonine protein kinase [Sandaracinaceae bacterium]
TYFVMEFLDGRSLTKVIEDDRPISPERLVKVAKQLCDALGAAHERGIVHRDMKPDNVYLIERGGDKDFVKVLDFGIAKVGGASSKLTRAGQVFGTPHYMSPEQCSGAAVDSRTDIYAVGVILYEMACGRVPFDADNLMGILTKHIYEQPIPPHQLPPPVAVPPGLEAVILKCLSKSVDTRYQTMAEVKRDLEAFEAGLTPNAVVEAVDRQGAPVRRDPTGRVTGGLQVEVGGETPAAEPKKSGLIAVVAALLVLALAGGGALLYFLVIAPQPTQITAVSIPPETGQPDGTQTQEAQPEGTQGSQEQQGQQTQVGQQEQGQQQAQQQAQQVEQPPPPPAPTFIELTSEPSGAEIYQGEVFLGNTPFRVQRPTDESTVAISLRLRSFVTQSIMLSARTGDNIRITL